MVRLITGAGGMMGSHLYDALRGQDVLPTYYDSTLDSRETITHEMAMLDVVSSFIMVKQFLEEYRPSVIYHLAAQSRPDVSFNYPARTIQTNVIGTINILQACAELGLKPLFINASSSAVYGDIDWSTPPNEERHCRPLSPYGTSKLAQEHIVKNFNQMHDIPYVNVRIFNCTGPRLSLIHI